MILAKVSYPTKQTELAQPWKNAVATPRRSFHAAISVVLLAPSASVAVSARSLIRWRIDSLGSAIVDTGLPTSLGSEEANKRYW